MRGSQPATHADIPDLIAALPDADPSLVARALDASSYAVTIRAGAAVLAMAGMVPDAGCARTWMLGTPHTSRHARWFVAETKRQMAEMLRRAPVLRAAVEVRYRRSFRWLRHCGWRIGFPALVDGALVCPVELHA